MVVKVIDRKHEARGDHGSCHDKDVDELPVTVEIVFRGSKDRA